MSEPVLSIENLHISIGKPLVHGISLDLQRGRIQGLAGESGSGKTLTSLAVLGLLPRSASVSGSIRLTGTELLGMRTTQLNRIRGSRIAMVFQDPSTALHPQIPIGVQLTDHLRTHGKISRRDARTHAGDMLERVAIPDPGAAMKRYPHQFSGGQRQRIAIAGALMCGPEVLLADEPTTALDVTVQAGILQLLRDLALERDLAVLLVTHDLGVMSAIADNVAVMRHGHLVESAPRAHLFHDPQDEYTRTLLAALPGSRLEAEDPVDPALLPDEETDDE